jgi:Mn2+/Fe2+ NRAMP family transporter
MPPVPEPRAHRTPGRHMHWHLARRRHFLLRAGTMAALLAVVGPGLLAGLSDDDPAGITTYSILGADFGYRLLWVLLLSTVALIVFHELGPRMGCVTGRGLAGLIRGRYGH